VKVLYVTIERSPYTIGGRKNHEIWNLVNWANNDGAIGRRLNCDRKSVAYQRKLRKIKPHSRGKKNHLEYVEGYKPLPENICI
jgi:hypothetical protein